MTSQQNIWVALIAVGIIAIASLFVAVGHTSSIALGSTSGVTNFSKLGVAQIKIGSGCDDGFKYAGCAGTSLNKFLQGTCNAIQIIPGSFAATTTQQFYCTVAGVVAGDNVRVSLPVGSGVNASGPGSPSAGFEPVSATATSTNAIQFTIANLTGAATSSFPQATTSLSYTVTD